MSNNLLTTYVLQQPQIILLKEGTDTSQGIPQLISNINACVAVADVVRTTLGPRGMDKLMHDERVRDLDGFLTSYLGFDFVFVVVESIFRLMYWRMRV